MRAWQRKEKSDEKDFGGRRTSGSGKSWYGKGDIKTDTFLIEDKQTDKNSYRIETKTWRKISNEALLSQRLPLLSLKIQETELIIISKSDFLSLIKLPS